MGTAPTQTRRSCSSGHRILTGNGCRRIFLVHGEPEGAGALAEELRGQGHSDVVMPTLHQSFEF